MRNEATDKAIESLSVENKVTRYFYVWCFGGRKELLVWIWARSVV